MRSLTFDRSLLFGFEKELDFSIEKYGLYDGVTGLTLKCFMLSCVFPELDYASRGSSLLDRLSDNIYTVDCMNFKEGLAGIGWAVDWLCDTRFLNLDSDDILGEVDNVLYSFVIDKPCESLFIDDGLLGYATYFLQRYRGGEDLKSINSKELSKECLTVLTDDLKERLVRRWNSFRVGDNTPSELSFKGVGQILFFLSEYLGTGVNIKCGEDILDITFRQAERLAARISRSEFEAGDFFAVHYMVISLFLAGRSCNIVYWESYSEELFILLLKTVDNNFYTSPKGHFILGLGLTVFYSSVVRSRCRKRINNLLKNPSGSYSWDKLFLICALEDTKLAGFYKEFRI